MQRSRNSQHPTSRQRVFGPGRPTLTLVLAATLGLVPPCEWSTPRAMAQFASPVYMDDSPPATEAMSRASELAGVGNLSEASLVLQRVLDQFAQSVVADDASGDPELFISVRSRIHELMLRNRPLLDRYRETEGPAARRMLQAGEAERVESTRLLTAAGFEAALIVAQEHAESANFDAAWRTLEQLDRHPDRTGDGAADAAQLLTTIAGFVEGTDPWAAQRVWTLADRWRTDAGLPGPAPRTAAPRPQVATTIDPFTPAGPTGLAGLLPRPLASASIGEPMEQLRSYATQISIRGLPDSAVTLHAAPSVSGDTVFVHDGRRITAWDRFTLAMKWRRHIDAPLSHGGSMYSSPLSLEDMSRITVQDPWLIAVTGVSMIGAQSPERTITRFDARDGSVVWTRTLGSMGAMFDESAVRGAAVVDQGVVVIAAVKQSQQKRLVSVSLIGLDLQTGETRWTRTLGSIGSLPWSNWRIGGGDESAVRAGVTYRSDRLGVIAAVESATGRPRWVRRAALTDEQQVGSGLPLWSTNTPVFHGDTLITLSPNRRTLLVLDAETGRLVRQRTTDRLGQPGYVLRHGDLLLAVSQLRIRALDLAADEWIQREPVELLDVKTMGIRGRVVIAGDQALVPVVDGVLSIDLAAALESIRTGAPAPEPVPITLESPGNFVAVEGQLLVVDDAKVHTYLLWDVAQQLLRDRMVAEPANPDPAITFAELSYQAGHPEHVLPAIDSALAAIERDPLSPNSERSRARLFRSLLAMVEPTGPSRPAAQLSPEQRGELVDRLARCASEPWEQVSSLLAAGRYFEAAGQPEIAVQKYQTILETPVLAAQTYTISETTLPAEAEATRRIRDLVRASGPTVYASYEAEAARLFEQAGAGAPPEDLETIARRFPLARSAPRAWMAAADRYHAQGRIDPAIFALEEGLRTSTDVLPTGDPLLGELAGRLLGQMQSAGRYVPALRELELLQRERPGLALTDRGRSIDPVALMSELRAAMTNAYRRPSIGPRLGEATTMLGWSAVEPACPRLPTARTNYALLGSGSGELTMWRFEPDGGAVKLWGGVPREMYLCMDATGIYFGRQVNGRSGTDQEIVCRDVETGIERWVTPAFRSIFDGVGEPTGSRSSQMIDTPLKAQAMLNELFILFDDHTLVMVERTGRTAAFDLTTGAKLWNTPRTVARVHDAALDAGKIIIGGFDQPPSNEAVVDAELRSAVVAIDARSGRELVRHGERQTIRWVRFTPEGHALIAGDRGLFALDVYRKIVRWRSESRPLEQTIEAWTMPGRAVVRDSSNELWTIRTETGQRDTEPLDAGGRLDYDFKRITATALGSNMLIATARGFIILDADGALVGADARPTDGDILPVAVADNYIVTLDADGDEQPGGETLYTLGVFSVDSGRAAAIVKLPIPAPTRPVLVTVVDHQILVTAGSATIRIPATP